MRRAADAGAMLDARAKQAYRRRLTEIEDDLKEAQGLGDTSRVEQATAEREFLAHELARAVGLEDAIGARIPTPNARAPASRAQCGTR